MRPERSIVKKAIHDTGGNLARSAALLGCTRQTLYTWVYQLGLERLAGIRPSTRDKVDRDSRMDKSVAGHGKSELFDSSGVQSAERNGPMLHVVEAQEAVDPIIAATVKIPESIWMRLKIQAIQEKTTMGAIVQRGLEHVLRPRERESGRAGK